jgi:bisanhydrobacterioruberin hydratase
MKNYYSQYIHPHKHIIATIICLMFHISGAIGISLGEQWFVIKTPLNLIISAGLILWTAPKINSYFIFFAILAVSIGMFVEWIGVNTQLLFGHYYYTDILGFQTLGVPWLIGCNWFIVCYCSGMISQLVFKKEQIFIRALIIASLATLFDYLMEPIAISLKFWQWLPDNKIPVFNYTCWFIFSFIIGLFYNPKKIEQNHFAIILLAIQALFFLTLRFTL